MGVASLIVWERQGHWAPRWRRALGPPPPAIREVRSAGECFEELSVSPGSILAVEFEPATAKRVLATLWEIEQFHPAARSLVLSGREFAEYAPQAFEAGARGFIISSRELSLAANFVRRHLELSTAHAATVQSLAKPELPQVVQELFAELARGDDPQVRRRCLETLARRLPTPELKQR
jgi:DNA-binding NarL/FixJ family response regulator